MDPPRVGRCVALVLCLSACSDPPPVAPSLAARLSEAIAGLPWEKSRGGVPAWCPDLSPCDTLWIESRVVQLPNPPPVFFVPAARPTLMVLEGDPLTALPALASWRRPVRFGDWGACRASRHDPGWASLRKACLAIGVAGDTTSDTLHLALLVLSPSQGLSWPRLRLLGQGGGWRSEIAWVGGE